MQECDGSSNGTVVSHHQTISSPPIEMSKTIPEKPQHKKLCGFASTNMSHQEITSLMEALGMHGRSGRVSGC